MPSSSDLQRAYSASRLRGANTGARTAIEYNNRKLRNLKPTPVDISRAKRIEADNVRLKKEIALRERILRTSYSGC